VSGDIKLLALQMKVDVDLVMCNDGCKVGTEAAGCGCRLLIRVFGVLF